jgi:hypothetical protein
MASQITIRRDEREKKNKDFETHQNFDYNTTSIIRKKLDGKNLITLRKIINGESEQL